MQTQIGSGVSKCRRPVGVLTAAPVFCNAMPERAFNVLLHTCKNMSPSFDEMATNSVCALK
eukprot:jgi/Botrbrau1/4374/Bobra.105_2s0020.1